MSFFSPKMPDPPTSSEPSQADLDQEASMERRRRAAYGGGRSSNIVTGSLGVGSAASNAGSLAALLGGSR